MDFKKLSKIYEESVTDSENDKSSIGTDMYEINMNRKMSNLSISRNSTINEEEILSEYRLCKILLIKLIFALLFLLISLIIQGFFMIYSDSYYKSNTQPLSDRIHDLFVNPPHWITYKLSNTLIAILTLSFIKIILFNSIYLSIAIVCRFIYIIGSFYIIRGILIYVTSLPATLDTCSPLESGNFLFNLLQIIKINTNLVYVCADLIVSGHSFSTTIFLMFSFYYINNKIIKFIIFIFSCFIYAIIIIGFIHYTSDVLLGIIFGVFMFSFYHIMLDISSQYYIFNKLFEIKIISNNKNIHAKPFFLRFFVSRIFFKIIPYLEGLNYTLDYAINKNNDLSNFCNCDNNNNNNNNNNNKIPLFSFYKPIREDKIIINYSDHLYHSYAGDGTINFLFWKFIKNIKKGSHK
ncbi:sphingomyelin synthase 2, putative [Plasmodium sp. gorilla clade G2]|uniref:sphingomyelin synthase 2, putative n=1 Tax=Plasmodium sp. gorilla clade G2 TaxID=880535 RepID=UPI000D205698|nr:sphingomyelin synthase 2, putative [Plasmodium sp. gorilla clade G2]SOV12660.1 sphingomyelin synthase 2, putative [Plasmodium sp. gorilla clade G2]